MGKCLSISKNDVDDNGIYIHSESINFDGDIYIGGNFKTLRIKKYIMVSGSIITVGKTGVEAGDFIVAEKSLACSSLKSGSFIKAGISINVDFDISAEDWIYSGQINAKGLIRSGKWIYAYKGISANDGIYSSWGIFAGVNSRGTIGTYGDVVWTKSFGGTIKKTSARKFEDYTKGEKNNG